MPDDTGFVCVLLLLAVFVYAFELFDFGLFENDEFRLVVEAAEIITLPASSFSDDNNVELTEAFKPQLDDEE